MSAILDRSTVDRGLDNDGPEDPRLAPRARLLAAFDDLALAIIAAGGPEKYEALRRCAQQAAAARTLCSVALEDFACGGPDGELGAVAGFVPRPIGGFLVPQQDVYRELIGLAKPILERMARKADEKPVADPQEWTYEVERLTALRSSFALGTAELDWDVPPAEECLALHVFLRVPGGEAYLRDVPDDGRLHVTTNGMLAG